MIGEDTAMLLLESPDGAIGTMSTSMTVPGAAPRSSDTLRLIGERGTITFKDWELRWSGGEAVERWDPEEAYQESFDGVIAHFADSLRRGAPFETSAVENLATLELVDDVYRLAGWR